MLDSSTSSLWRETLKSSRSSTKEAGYLGSPPNQRQIHRHIKEKDTQKHAQRGRQEGLLKGWSRREPWSLEVDAPGAPDKTWKKTGWGGGGVTDHMLSISSRSWLRLCLLAVAFLSSDPFQNLTNPPMLSGQADSHLLQRALPASPALPSLCTERQSLSVLLSSSSAVVHHFASPP